MNDYYVSVSFNVLFPELFSKTFFAFCCVLCGALVFFQPQGCDRKATNFNPLLDNNPQQFSRVVLILDIQR